MSRFYFECLLVGAQKQSQNQLINPQNCLWSIIGMFGYRDVEIKSLYEG